MMTMVVMKFLCSLYDLQVGLPFFCEDDDEDGGDEFSLLHV